MDKIKLLKEFLKEWENGNRENSYKYCKEIWLNEEDWEEFEFGTELENLLTELSFPQYNYTFIGSFESCGYDLICNCLSIIDDEGKLITFPINFENY